MLLEVNANPSMRIEHEQEVRPFSLTMTLEYNFLSLAFLVCFFER